MRQGAIVIDSADPEELSEFYRKLLKWERSEQVFEGERWFILTPVGKGVPLVFQLNLDYEPPVWPAEPGGQQQMMHLDFYVEASEMEQSTRHALECGAVLAKTQFSESWRVFLDPAGHPFCIIPIPPEQIRKIDEYWNTVTP